MDSLTQIVLGAAVGEATLGKKVGNKAIFWGAVGGTIPDLDVLSKHFTDSLSAIEIHRGFSHSIVFCILMAPLLGFLVQKIHHKEPATWKNWSLLFFWALFTHPILDSFTTWGTQLFWPAEMRLAFKNIFVLDPSYTIPFLLCVTIAMFYKRTNPKRAQWNQLGIYISSFYMLLSLGAKAYTYQVFKDKIDNQQVTYSEIQTRPSPMNIILWNANIKTENGFYMTDYSLLDKENELKLVFHASNKQLEKEIADQQLVSRIIKITEGWYIVEKNNPHSYLFHDLRFGVLSSDLSSNKYAFSYEIYRESGIWKGREVEKNRQDLDMKNLLGKLWHRILGKVS
ncbi:MAG: metal-dependent hydrolase [Flavobacteriales bacterium]|jgi:inner membrane protein|nr:metal-dependent hydrolase [Flavobacteriales bacterium]